MKKGSAILIFTYKILQNQGVKKDWEFRCAPFPTSYPGRWAEEKGEHHGKKSVL